MDTEQNQRIVVDVDGVVARKHSGSYENCLPNQDIIEKIRGYRERGFYIILHTARNMRTFEGRIGKINAETAPVLLDWLEKHDIPFDEIIFGKPWCGNEGFYIDDKAIRPEEFLKMSEEEIQELVKNE